MKLKELIENSYLYEKFVHKASNLRDMSISRLLTYKLFHNNIMFIALGALTGSMIVAIPVMAASKGIYEKNKDIDSVFEVLDRIHELDLNAYGSEGAGSDDVDFEVFKIEFDVIKIEKGKRGVLEYLKPRKKIKMRFEEISAMLEKISNSGVFMLKDIQINRINNNEFEVDFVMVKRLMI
ncbi:MAG: hypothetical protein KAH32_02400 [Chlamydiia bacterium]|nr:hypothetical protein [Chlamydiia bacterium]